jgi:hypothetical protein
MSIKVAFQSVIGTYDLFLRGTLPNDQTVHEIFTVNITVKPPIIINLPVEEKFAQLKSPIIINILIAGTFAQLLTNEGPPHFKEPLPSTIEIGLGEAFSLTLPEV